MKEIEHRAKEVAKRIIYHRENSTLSETQAEVIILEGLTQTRLDTIAENKRLKDVAAILVEALEDYMTAYGGDNDMVMKMIGNRYNRAKQALSEYLKAVGE